MSQIDALNRVRLVALPTRHDAGGPQALAREYQRNDGDAREDWGIGLQGPQVAEPRTGEADRYQEQWDEAAARR